MEGTQTPQEMLSPYEVRKGLILLFQAHAVLNDHIMHKNALPMQLSAIMNEAKVGHDGPNDQPTVWLRNFCKAMRVELDELEESLAWKWWKPSIKTDMENVRVEIIDIFHFLLSAAMASGMNADDFAEIYYRKRALNFRRQDVGFVEGDNKLDEVGKL